MNTETVYFQSGEFGNFAIQIDGLSTLMAFLKTADPALQKGMRDGLKEAVQPVLIRARGKASAIADDGTYAASLGVGSRANGSSWVLKSSDEAAGVKEFAHLGARTISTKGTPRANARFRKHSGVGVPRRAHAPRAMVPAVDESVDEVKSRIDAHLAKVLERAND